ncbi:hypothetical protein [Streptomyces sp. NPDC001292]
MSAHEGLTRFRDRAASLGGHLQPATSHPSATSDATVCGGQ